MFTQSKASGQQLRPLGEMALSTMVAMASDCQPVAVAACIAAGTVGGEQPTEASASGVELRCGADGVVQVSWRTLWMV